MVPPQSGCDTRQHTIVKHILWYITGTRSYGCRYAKKLEESRFVSHSDSDMAGDVDEIKKNHIKY